MASPQSCHTGEASLPLLPPNNWEPRTVPLLPTH
jgi:hypothetical protein